MMNTLSLVLDLLLAGYLVRQVIQFGPQYRRLKQAIADGDPQARIRLYYQALVFEWVSALLALSALRFDWNKLNPKILFLDNLPVMHLLPRGNDFDRDTIIGATVGITLGLIATIVAAKLRGDRSASLTPASRWSKVLPDFSALIPVTRQERLLWIAVAISAGIGEEIVFRGWLLATLKGRFALGGTALVVVAAVAFGLAHAYQKIPGIVLTGIAGAFFACSMSKLDLCWSRSCCMR